MQIGVVVDDRLLAVVDRGEVRFGDREADRVGEALAERPGRDLDARRDVNLGVAGRLAAELAEVLEIVERESHAGQIDERIEQHRAVAGAQDETIAVGPMRVGRVEAQMPAPERVGHRRRAERQPRMARVRLLDRVDREHADGVDAFFVVGAVHWSLPSKVTEQARSPPNGRFPEPTGPNKFPRTGRLARCEAAARMEAMDELEAGSKRWCAIHPISVAPPVKRSTR